MNISGIMNAFNKNSTKPRSVNVQCTACLRGDKATDAHKCINCKKNVHIFDECSQSCDDEEGYGERRLCLNCAFMGNQYDTDFGTGN